MFWFEDSGFANDICKLVYEKYKGLGKKGKPAVEREWTILAAVVVVFEQEGQGNVTFFNLILCGECKGNEEVVKRG